MFYVQYIISDSNFKGFKQLKFLIFAQKFDIIDEKSEKHVPKIRDGDKRKVIWYWTQKSCRCNQPFYHQKFCLHALQSF